MQLVDHAFILLLFALQPVHGAFESRYYAEQAKAGRPADRVRFYRQTALIEWIFFVFLIAAWLDFGRPLADLGFVLAGGTGFWIGVLFCLVLTGYLLYSWRAARNASPGEKDEIAGTFGDLAIFLPRTRRELKSFYAVSITAGIVEEIVYRGFVIWYLGRYMPVWAAVIVSSVAFGLGHSYQGTSGALRTGLAGLALAILYVGTGSIWLPIVAHILLDVLQGATINEILSKDDEHVETVRAQ